MQLRSNKENPIFHSNCISMTLRKYTGCTQNLWDLSSHIVTCYSVKCLISYHIDVLYISYDIFPFVILTYFILSITSKCESHHLCVGTNDRWPTLPETHYCDVIMGAVASQITSITIVYSTVYSDADQRKHQSSASLAFVPPVNSPHKWPVMRKMFPFDDVITETSFPNDIFGNNHLINLFIPKFSVPNNAFKPQYVIGVCQWNVKKIPIEKVIQCRITCIGSRHSK